MKLKLNRIQFTDISTIGELWLEDERLCFTLEDKVRPLGDKIKGKTAIPADSYKVIINWSGRFKRPMPLLLDVSNFEGVRIHSGNTEADTEGCILVGFSRSPDFVGNSKKAFDVLFSKMLQAIQNDEEIMIDISPKEMV